MLLNELFLTEHLTDVTGDVDYIYNLAFREPLAYIQRNARIETDTFQKVVIDTEALRSPDAVQAHSVNPCRIYLQDPSRPGSFYIPGEGIISMQTDHNAISFVRYNCEGSLETATQRLQSPLRERLAKEFTPAVAKGTIHHELVHWIDDSLHNQHIQQRVARAKERQLPSLEQGRPIDADYLEIQAQIHNVYQLKQEYKRVWDQLSFSEMLAFSPALSVINSSLTGSDKIHWLKNLKARMAREGLLGQRMR